ncbi:MAG: hypothetical protein IJ758_03260 [Clostridia bacterium]|nr:hypothetical protein [Clostridia bacterium]
MKKFLSIILSIVVLSNISIASGAYAAGFRANKDNNMGICFAQTKETAMPKDYDILKMEVEKLREENDMLNNSVATLQKRISNLEERSHPNRLCRAIKNLFFPDFPTILRFIGVYYFVGMLWAGISDLDERFEKLADVVGKINGEMNNIVANGN